MFQNLIRRFYALDSVTLNPGVGGDLIGTDNIGGIEYEVVKQAFGDQGDLQLVAQGNPLPIRPVSSSGDTNTIPYSASSVTLSPASSIRIGCTIINTSTAALCVKLGATATTSDFTVRLVQYGYYEVPYGYWGVVDAIWEAGSGGGANVTDLV